VKPLIYKAYNVHSDLRLQELRQRNRKVRLKAWTDADKARWSRLVDHAVDERQVYARTYRVIEQLARSSVKQAKEGETPMVANLASRFANDMTERLLRGPLSINVTTDDPDEAKYASRYEIVVKAVARQIELDELANELVFDMLTSNYACVEVLSQDDLRYVYDVEARSRQVSSASGFVSDDDIIAMGINPEDIEVDDVGPGTVADTLAVPSVKRIHPLRVILPHGCKNPNTSTWFGILRFATIAELAELYGGAVDQQLSKSQWDTLYEVISGEAIPSVAHNVMITDHIGLRTIAWVDLYIRRDPANPANNFTMTRMILGSQGNTIGSEPISWGGGITPYVFRMARAHSEIESRTVIGEVSPFVRAYSDLTYAITTDAKKLAHRKYSGIDVSDADWKLLTNPDYTGKVDVRPDSVVDVTLGTTMTADALQIMQVIKGFVGTASGFQSIDNGDVPASSSAALVSMINDSSLISIGSFAKQVSALANDVLSKVMSAYLEMAVQPEKYALPDTFGDLVRPDKIIDSRVTISVGPSGIAADIETKATATQLIRLISTSPQIAQAVNMRVLVEWILSVFGVPPGALSSNAQQPPAQGATEGQPLPGGPLAGEERDMVLGQHPERLPGEQSATGGALSVGNMVAGAARIGDKR
jgi:hypothetical protein